MATDGKMEHPAIEQHLTLLFGTPLQDQLEICGEMYTSSKVWHTPYGICFFAGPDRWAEFSLDYLYYKYDSQLDGVVSGYNETGYVSAAEIRSVLKQLEKAPCKMRVKPDSVRRLEEVTGECALRVKNHFGMWQVTKTSYWSAITNPFGLPGSFSTSENNFELWLIEWEDSPMDEKVDLFEVEDILKDYGYTRDTVTEETV